jgi:hypothetical protein
LWDTAIAVSGDIGWILLFGAEAAELPMSLNQLSAISRQPSAKPRRICCLRTDGERNYQGNLRWFKLIADG